MIHAPDVDPLKGYQSYAVEWALNRLFTRDCMGAALFLDPGLGKTRTTLTIFDILFSLREIRRALVVAPLRPMYSVWPAEIRKWKFNRSHIVLHQQHRQAMAENCKIEIVNPEGLDKLRNVEGRWDIIAIDESTKFKTWKTKRFKTLREMLPTIPKRLILTGTPAANSLADLHAQMFIVDNGEALGRTQTDFRREYMERGGYLGREWVFRDDKKDEILEKIADRALRMQAEDHLDMPRLVKNDIWCTLPGPCLAEYKKLKRELFIQLATGDIFANSAAGAYTKCKQYANGACYSIDPNTGKRESHRAHDEKIGALIDLHEELNGKPLLIAYQFEQDMIRIKQTSAFKHTPVINGNSKEKDVHETLRLWNLGRHPAMLCQTASMSHGVNAQEACNDVAFFGLCDSPEVYDQFFRRVYRLGVKGSQVRIHRILMEGTVDEAMLDRIEGKGATQAAFLESLKRHAAA